MRKRWFLVGMIFLLLSWLLVGCGVAQEQYDAVVSDIGKAQQELQSTKAELAGVQVELETAQSELDTAKAELKSAETELETLQVAKTTLLAEKDSLTAERESLQTDYDKLADENQAVQSELADIKKVYPPRDFSSLTELQDWLLSNDVSERPVSTYAENWYMKALEIQEDALNDGYIVSAWIDYYPGDEIYSVFCTAVVDGDVWMWDPETDEPFNFSDATGLLELR